MLEPWKDPFIIRHSITLDKSFRKWTHKGLLSEEEEDPMTFAKKLYEADIVLLSHGIQLDPVFNYANISAQKLWGYTWEEFTILPSRLSAAENERAERGHMLQSGASNGIIFNYSGIRVSKNGHRFRIEDVILWNVLDDAGMRIGQAATFKKWTDL